MTIGEALRGVAAAGDRQARERARDALAAEVQRVVLRKLEGRFRLGAATREDLGQAATASALLALERGNVKSGSEEAYVRRCATHAAISYFRKRRETLVDPADVQLVDTTTVGFDQSVKLDYDRLVDLIVELVPEMRSKSWYDSFRRVRLLNHSIESVTHDEIVKRVRNRSASDPPSEVDCKRARAFVDNHLRLAKNWIQTKAIAARLKGELD